MQKSHLDKFQRLADEGKLLSAGSVSDPAESIQGIAVFFADVDSPVEKWFLDDELVQGGFQKIQATRMRLEHGTINTGKNSRSGMQEYRMVLFENAAEKDAADRSPGILEESRQAIQSMYGEKQLRLSVWLDKNQAGRQRVLVMEPPENETELKNRLRKIPAVKSGLWKVRILPVFFGKGSLNSS